MERQHEEYGSDEEVIRETIKASEETSETFYKIKEDLENKLKK